MAGTEDAITPFQASRFAKQCKPIEKPVGLTDIPKVRRYVEGLESKLAVPIPRTNVCLDIQSKVRRHVERYELQVAVTAS